MTGLDMGLKCDVLGNPPPVVSWTKNNIELKIGREMHSKYSYSYTLKITNMSEIDLGEYTCSAFNILGNDVGVTTIKGKYFNILYMLIFSFCEPQTMYALDSISCNVQIGLITVCH